MFVVYLLMLWNIVASMCGKETPMSVTIVTRCSLDGSLVMLSCSTVYRNSFAKL